ncbi:MAG: sugar ABC transporter substrate-binding protein [Nitrospiraceae bacterium]
MKKYPRKPCRTFVVAMETVALSMTLGCAGESASLVKEAKSVPNEFLLGPEDVLEVNVWRNQDLSRSVVIRPDGMISMPLIGDVQAGGPTANQLAVRIADRLKEYKENPSVSVSVKEVNSYSVFVVGEVAKPGKYQFKSYTSVLQAIAQACGFTLFASKNKLQVVRNVQNGDGQPHGMRIPLRYDDLVAGKGGIGNLILKPGDIVVVP